MSVLKTVEISILMEFQLSFLIPTGWKKSYRVCEKGAKSWDFSSPVIFYPQQLKRKIPTGSLRQGVGMVGGMGKGIAFPAIYQFFSNWDEKLIRCKI